MAVSLLKLKPGGGGDMQPAKISSCGACVLLRLPADHTRMKVVAEPAAHCVTVIHISVKPSKFDLSCQAQLIDVQAA